MNNARIFVGRSKRTIINPVCAGSKANFAFTGTLRPGSYDAGEALPFDLHYNSPGVAFGNNRHLTCAQHGVYVFHLSVMAGTKRCAVLIHNQKERMRVIANDKQVMSQASNMIVIEWRNGEDVWVQSCNDATTDWEESESMASILTGFLQHKL